MKSLLFLCLCWFSLVTGHVAMNKANTSDGTVSGDNSYDSFDSIFWAPGSSQEHIEKVRRMILDIQHNQTTTEASSSHAHFSAHKLVARLRIPHGEWAPGRPRIYHQASCVDPKKDWLGSLVCWTNVLKCRSCSWVALNGWRRYCEGTPQGQMDAKNCWNRAPRSDRCCEGNGDWNGREACNEFQPHLYPDGKCGGQQRNMCLSKEQNRCYMAPDDQHVMPWNDWIQLHDVPNEILGFLMGKIKAPNSVADPATPITTPTPDDRPEVKPYN